MLINPITSQIIIALILSTWTLIKNVGQRDTFIHCHVPLLSSLALISSTILLIYCDSVFFDEFSIICHNELKHPSLFSNKYEKQNFDLTMLASSVFNLSSI